MFTPQMLVIGMAVLMGIFLLPALVAPKKFRKEIKNYTSETNLVRATGGLYLVISFLFLSVHWKFSGGWYIVVPILGWLTFLKGLVWVWFPDLVKRMVKKNPLLDSEAGVAIMAVIGIAIAIFLVYIATEMLVY